MSAFDDYLAAPAQPQAQSFDAYLGASAAQSPTVSPSSAPSAALSPATAAQPGMLSSGLVGFAKGLGSTATGLEKLVGKGINAIAPNGSAAQQVGNYLTNDANFVNNDMAQGAAPYQAAHPFVTGAGNLAGQVVGTAPTMAIGPEYAGLGLAGRLGVGAAQGAAGGAILSGGDPMQTGVGGLLGAAGPLVAAGAGAAGRGLWNAIQPVVQPGTFVGRGIAAGMDPAAAAAAAQNIRSAPTFVPGSTPTLAQAAANPYLVQTEKAAANMPAVKNALMQNAIGNNDARWQALMGVAGTPADMAAAQTARDAAASPLYQQAHQSTANVGPAFMRYAQIPEMQQAMQAAQNTAALDAAVGRGVAPVWPTPNSNAINGSALDYTSRALADMISDAQRTGATSRAASLSALKSNVDNWTQRYIPGVGAAKAAYAAGSVPINTMDVGQQIANGLGTRAMNAGGAPEIQMMPFRAALTKAMNSGDAAKYGIDANALNTLQGIGQDLQRATVSNSVRQPGSDTAYNLAANGWLARQLYGPTFGGAGNIGKAVGALGATALGHPMVGLGILGGANRLGQMVGNRLQGHLAGLLTDPNAILPYLDARAAAPAQAIPGPLMQGLLNYGRPAVVNGLIGGFGKPANQ